MSVLSTPPSFAASPPQNAKSAPLPPFQRFLPTPKHYACPLFLQASIPHSKTPPPFLSSTPHHPHPPRPCHNQMLPPPQSVLSTAASVAASVMLARTIANDLLPCHVQDRLFSTLQTTFLRRFSARITIIIDEFNGFTLNKLYAAAHLYLGTKISTSATRRLRVSKDDSEKHLSVAMERGETVVDVFQDMKLEWQFIRHENHKYVGNDTTVQQSHSLYLRFREKHKDKVLQDYLPRVLAQAKAMMDEKKTLRLYTVDYEAMRMYGYRCGPWKSASLNHPATFSTVAMDAEAKEALLEDLERFVKRKDSRSRRWKLPQQRWLRS